MNRYTFREYEVPERTREAIDKYIATHLPVGGFLTAVLSNNLRDAVCRADPDNLKNLPAIVAYINNKAPYDCWGSPERVAKWTKEAA